MVHDEAETGTCRSVETIHLACGDDLLVKIVLDRGETCFILVCKVVSLEYMSSVTECAYRECNILIEELEVYESPA